MSTGRSPANLLDRTVDRLLVLLFALLFMQSPAFLQQYQQRLSGAHEEIRRVVSEMAESASYHGKSLTAYIKKFQVNSDLEIRAQGDLMQKIVERESYLASGVLSLSSASPLTRPFVFLKHLDTKVALGTFASFKPALELSIESFLWGAVGAFFALFLYSSTKRLVRRIC